ncbi:MAG: hypothetical protein H7257_10145 [Taibaiella sp.]|nr:hypothetical protein [Taibaiella sp.]
MAVATVSCMLWLIVRHYPTTYRLIIFFPLAGTLISFFQVYYSFCVAFGVFGMFSFNGSLSNKAEINLEYLRKDRIKAFKIIGGGTLLSALLTVAFYFLPV